MPTSSHIIYTCQLYEALLSILEDR